MKILFLSDIHLDINTTQVGRDLLPDLIAYIESKKADVVMIAGDISDNFRTTINVLNILNDSIEGKVFFIPGNHDIWVDKGQSSWKAYEAFRAHGTSLIDRPYALNNEYILIGDMGWYDYSFGPETIHRDVFEEKKKKLWKDGMYAHWNRSDEEMVEQMVDTWRNDLEKYKDKKIIFVNHFVPFYDFITTSNSDNNWNMKNGYMGSRKIGDLILAYPNIEWFVFGHTHRKFGVIKDYKGHNFICNPIGYTYEWVKDTFQEELEECGFLLDL